MNTPNAKGKTILDYIPEALQKLKGKAQPEGVAQETISEGRQAIDKKAIEKAAETLKKYKDGKTLKIELLRKSSGGKFAIGT